jgi:hypothetical protein
MQVKCRTSPSGRRRPGARAATVRPIASGAARTAAFLEMQVVCRVPPRSGGVAARASKGDPG